jgi:hypothetical protein
VPDGGVAVPVTVAGGDGADDVGVGDLGAAVPLGDAVGDSSCETEGDGLGLAVRAGTGACDAEMLTLGDGVIPASGVSLFVPLRDRTDESAVSAYDELRSEAEPYGLQVDPVAADDDRWAEKLAILISRPALSRSCR